MHTTALRSWLASSLLVATLAACSCSSKSDPAPCTLASLSESCGAPSECCSGACAGGICVEPVGECAAVDAPCTVPADCCTGLCNGTTCVQEGACTLKGLACSVPADCCTGNCANGLCADALPVCALLAEPCVNPPDCCSGACEGGVCVVPPTPTCGELGASCATGAECCSAICAGGSCTTDVVCGAPITPCSSPNDCCSLECPGAGSPGATCAANVCLPATTACASDGQCCSGICDAGGHCAELPPGSTGATCTTLGEQCAGPLECCSKNCQGTVCAPSATCNATGDVCYAPGDCCSGLCAPPANPGEPGRCADAPGGCAQDGIPCDNGSNCCTRLCVDLGTGTKVCQPSGGCRMTGNYCDSTDACCNINDVVPPAQAVQCTADHTCDNGGACNPPGNICGASTDVNASQNCCNGKKDVCKPDSNGILRCFGGPPGSCNNSGCSGTCPTGWDPNDPLCCIQPGEVCQFRDQCCSGAPCVPDAAGVLRCAATVACKPRGTRCTDAADTSCCEGLSCIDVTEIGFVCTDQIDPPPPGCILSGLSCTVGAGNPCCSGLCTTPPGTNSGTCAACAPNGDTCTSNAQCCSNECDPVAGVCRKPCVGDAGACTVDGDCCAGLACDVQPGDTGGTCTSGGAGTCADTGQSCAVDADCCTYDPLGQGGDLCIEGVCSTVVTCASVSQSCLVDGDCCSGAGLTCVTPGANVNDPPVPCPPNPTAPCTCEVTTCAPIAADCSTTLPCCNGYCALKTNTAVLCDTTDTTQCTCVPIG